ncbi:MAG: protein translocase subunit SecD [Chloroflexota bacterium]
MRNRNRTWLTFALILLLAIPSIWLALPTDVLDINGYKASHPIRQGLDLQGGLQVVLQAEPVAGQTLDRDTLEGTRATLERRVNGLGVSEPVIQIRGNDQIIVELPGVDDPQQAVEVLQQTALLEIIDPQGQYLAPGTVVDTSLGPADRGTGDGASATPVAASDTGEPAGPVYETIVSGSDLRDAYVATGNTGFGQVVGFELQGDGADKFYDFTSTNLGQPMSIVIDKTVISSPQVNGAISDRGIIEGVAPKEVANLVIQLKAGALAVPLELAQSRTVGPTLGKDSIDRSILAGIVGLGTVALFMILYYRLPGVISVVALLIYTAITFSLFKIIPVTLTLAGIAGFILSIGMAVDANVLIFARLKEELRSGRPLGQAIEAGFDHAWPSIRDSNISTMITTVILYFFGRYTGTSIITGFALTLFLGVVVSMFTAIIVTRTLLRMLISSDALLDERFYYAGKRAASAASAAD